jgi:restriction-modification enzyme MmeI-like protein
MTVEAALRVLADRWSVAEAAERANFQPYLIELCHALRVEPPRPAGSGYEFEYSIAQTLPDGREAPGFIDCYKRGHFILEAKDEEEGRSREAMLRLAFGTAKARLANLRDPAPPYLLVMDVGTTLMAWDSWDGGFGGFQAGRRIDLTRLADRDEDAPV